MLRKHALFASVAALGVLVTSCGDDDPDPTPTPTSTSTATPTPTPTSSQVEFDLSQAFDAESTNANLSYAFFTADGGMDSVFSGATRTNGTAVIDLAFSPESVSFGFPDLADRVNFVGSELVTGDAMRRIYQRTGERLELEVPFQYILRASYDRVSDFTRDGTAGELDATRSTLFFATVSTSDDITGVLSYTGSFQVFGGDPGTTEEGTVSAPDITVTVTPGATDNDPDEASGTVQIFEAVNGVATLVASFPFEADINAASGFSVAIEDEARNIEGNLSGALAGPNREEVLLIFSATSTETDNDTRYVGTFIGER